MERPGAHAGRRERTRAQVEEVALAVFREHGVDAVTVEQLCAAAGIAPATFYRYFGTKDGVLFAYRPAFLEVIREAVAALPGGLGRGEQVRVAKVRFADFLDEHADALSARDDIVAENPVLLPRTLLVQREWETELAAALARARGVPASDPAARLDAALGLLVVRVGFRRWRGGDAPTLAAAMPAAFDEVAGAQDRLRRPPPEATPGAVRAVR